ncbi:ankyrin repeat-containing protein [Rutstroemia sp. NJR-2017a BVV2]|nr:ankyrin repeat-containing protein [Rutstroemia sp. NJR-2017a BVV2]
MKGVPTERPEYTAAVGDIVHKFLGDNVSVVGSTSIAGSYVYEVKIPEEEGELSQEELQKLQVLCRLRCNQIQQSLPPSPQTPQSAFHSTNPPSYRSPSTILPSPTPTATVSPPAPSSPPQKLVPKNRPDTIRIKNIPISYTKDVVKLVIGDAFKSTPLIHSLAPYSKDYLCATVTFPEEKDLEYPTKRLPAIRQAHQQKPGKADFQYDVDFFNFTPLWDAAFGDKEVIVDIVAVVGLGTHAFGTFRSPSAGSHEMWLRDFLPKDIPKTRILLYGYPSTVDGGQSIEKVEDIASTFLNRLTMFRRGTSTRERPIIFIGQSLGGLIVQEALLKAQNSPDANEVEIFNSWHGLVGFGIPIGGLRNPSLIEAVKNQPNKVLIRQLCLDELGTPSDYLKQLKVNFERCCEGKKRVAYAPEILYFWERHYSQPRTRNGIVGDKVRMVEDTETPGARNLPLNANHSEMVKYRSRSDLLYEDVWLNINGMVDNIVEKKQILAAQTSPSNKAQKGKGKPGGKGPRGGPRRKGTFISGDEDDVLHS